ncbi:MAG: trypsin-like peptidase domain-containing protein [Oscillospiraceae bacterium]|nr:trypsin-like peptidase domain-containing protein [Oscillospiraceae bacterium]
MNDDLQDILSGLTETPETPEEPESAEIPDIPEQAEETASGSASAHTQSDDIIGAILGAEQRDGSRQDLFGLAPPEGIVPAEPVRRQRHLLLKTALTLLTLGVLGFAVFCIVWDVRHGTADQFYPAGNIVRVQINRQMEPHPASALVDENGRYSFEGIAETVMPSIVEIYTYKDDHMLGSGSGIILTADGYIATNAHVIANAESLSVRLYGTEDDRYTATVVGHDTKTDLAILKIAADNLPPAVLGNSDNVRMGETVCALGNPAGLHSSITTGIISGVNRKVRAESTNFEMECFQTDAAISPGNSGGALVNLYGEVIGITSSKYNNNTPFGSGNYEGLGFAITVNEAMPILTELIEQGYVSGRVRIGIRFLENAEALREAANDGVQLPAELNGKGLLIKEIDEDSDLNNTTIQPGDWILAMNGRDISDYDSVNEVISELGAGDSVHCRCGRIREDGTLQTFEIDFRLLEDHSGNY